MSWRAVWVVRLYGVLSLSVSLEYPKVARRVPEESERSLTWKSVLRKLVSSLLKERKSKREQTTFYTKRPEQEAIKLPTSCPKGNETPHKER